MSHSGGECPPTLRYTFDQANGNFAQLHAYVWFDNELAFYNPSADDYDYEPFDPFGSNGIDVGDGAAAPGPAMGLAPIPATAAVPATSPTNSLPPTPTIVAVPATAAATPPPPSNATAPLSNLMYSSFVLLLIICVW